MLLRTITSMALPLSLALVASACATPPPTPLYEGPQRPAEEVTKLFAPHGTARVIAIDEREVDGIAWLIEPGAHRIWVRVGRGFDLGVRIPSALDRYCGFEFEASGGQEVHILDDVETNPNRGTRRAVATQLWLIDQDNEMVETTRLGCSHSPPGEIEG